MRYKLLIIIIHILKKTEYIQNNYNNVLSIKERERERERERELATQQPNYISVTQRCMPLQKNIYRVCYSREISQARFAIVANLPLSLTAFYTIDVY